MSEEKVSRSVTCGKCGSSYEVIDVYEVDTWNLGHYGCTYDKCPRHLVRTIDNGCPHCKKKKSKKPLFTRGYQESRERLAKNSYYSRSCFNCACYYQASGDKEEVCQNPEVLEYDMVVSENNVYCLHWRPSSSNKTEQQSLFKKSGRSRLD